MTIQSKGQLPGGDLVKLLLKIREIGGNTGSIDLAIDEIGRGNLLVAVGIADKYLTHNQFREFQVANPATYSMLSDQLNMAKQQVIAQMAGDKRIQQPDKRIQQPLPRPYVPQDKGAGLYAYL